MKKLAQILREEGLAPRKSAAWEKSHYVAIVNSDDRIAWSTEEVWAEVQKKWPKDMVREALTGEDLRSRGWDKYSEEEAWALIDEMTDAYNREYRKIEKWLNHAVAQGEIRRRDNRIHGGKWLAL